MQGLNTIADYFGVIGINDKFRLNRKSESNKNAEKYVTNLEIYYGYYNGELDHLEKEHEQWINLDGVKTVWLRVLYNQKAPAITQVEFLHMPVDGKRLKIHASFSYLPVPVKRLGEERSDHKFEGNDEMFYYYTGSYDLTTILECEPKKDYHMVLCYKIQNKKNYDPAIEHFILMVANLKKEAGMNGYKYQGHVPKGYQPLHYGLGRREKNRYLAFKRKKPITSYAFSPEILDRYPLEDHKHNPFSHALPLFCFPKGITLSRTLRDPISFSFILTQQDGRRIYGTCLNFDEPFPLNLIDQLGHVEITKEKPLFIQKSIVIISRYPFLSEFKEFLKQIYRVHLSKSPIPVERIICNFIDEVPLPDRGKVGVLYELGKPIHFKRPENYPMISDDSIKYLFTALSIHNIINLMEFVLLERKIYLISEHPSLITHVTDAITGLIFPFVWSHVLIPILPDEMKEFIQAPVPFIIGLNSKGEELNYTTLEAVKVYLDSDELIYSDNIPPLPEASVKALTKRLQSFSKLHINFKAKLQTVDLAFEINLIDPEEEDRKYDPYEIRDAFFEFMCSILKYYPKFFKPPTHKSNEIINFSDVFDTKEFLAMNKANKQGTFLSKLVETAIFSYFIETRCMESKFDAEYQLLDSILAGKKGKKDQKVIKPITLNKIFSCSTPNTESLLPGRNLCYTIKQKIDLSIEVYQYTTFPRLKKELYIKPRPVERICVDVIKPIKNSHPIEELNKMDDQRWAQFLLEHIYYLWFLIFNVKLKQNQDDYYIKLTEYACFLLDDMLIKGLHPNDSIYKYLIEACGYCGMTDRALELATKMHSIRPEGNPSAHGIYLEALAKAKENKNFKEKQEVLRRSLKFDTTTINSHEEQKSGETPDKLQSQQNFIPNNVVLPFINFNLTDQCPKCSRTLFTEEIISGWKRSYNDYVTKCNGINCNGEFVANFKIIEYKPNNIIKEAFISFLSPLLIKKEIENLIKLHGEETLFNEKFEEEHQVIYWNCILYSNLIKAPTFFFEKTYNKEYIQNSIYNFGQMLIQRYNRPCTTTTSSLTTQFRDFVFNSSSKNEQNNSFSKSPISLNRSSNSSNGSNPNNANAKIKKVFSGHIAEFRVLLDKKMIDLEHEKAINEKSDSLSAGGTDLDISITHDQNRMDISQKIKQTTAIDHTF